MPPTGHRRQELGTVIEMLIRAHQLVVNILQTPGLAQMIDDLRDPQYRTSISADALTEARKRGIQIPDNAAVFVRENLQGWEFEIQAILDEQMYIVGFNSTRGFYVR